MTIDSPAPEENASGVFSSPPFPPGFHDAFMDFLKSRHLQPVHTDVFIQALTHSSFAFEHPGFPDNERLEFLGDALLSARCALFLYRRFPKEPEGELSRMRSFLVSRKELGRRAETMGLHELVLLGKGEEETGGRQRASVTGSALEAWLGAMALNGLHDQLAHLVEAELLIPGLESLEGRPHPDSKTRLQEFLQKTRKMLPEYVKVSKTGPSHEPWFEVEVRADQEVLARGRGSRIKTAENQAASRALKMLTEEKEEPSPES